jgi:hypothetical protein
VKRFIQVLKFLMFMMMVSHVFSSYFLAVESARLIEV